MNFSLIYFLFFPILIKIGFPRSDFGFREIKRHSKKTFLSAFRYPFTRTHKLKKQLKESIKCQTLISTRLERLFIHDRDICLILLHFTNIRFVVSIKIHFKSQKGDNARYASNEESLQVFMSHPFLKRVKLIFRRNFIKSLQLCFTHNRNNSIFISR